MDASWNGRQREGDLVSMRGSKPPGLLPLFALLGAFGLPATIPGCVASPAEAAARSGLLSGGSVVRCKGFTVSTTTIRLLEQLIEPAARALLRLGASQRTAETHEC
jgi:hypothetical protein